MKTLLKGRKGEHVVTGNVISIICDHSKKKDFHSFSEKKQIFFNPLENRNDFIIMYDYILKKILDPAEMPYIKS